MVAEKTIPTCGPIDFAINLLSGFPIFHLDFDSQPSVETNEDLLLLIYVLSCAYAKVSF